MLNPTYGVFISEPGVSVTDAKTNQFTMNTTMPHLKIDTQNQQGFATVLLLIVNDPPEPAVGNVNYTVVGKFKHGYTYTPKVEALFWVKTKPVNGTAADYFLDTGVISQSSIADYATLYCVADKTWVYFIVCKNYQAGIAPNPLTGSTIQISVHTFVDGVLDT